MMKKCRWRIGWLVNLAALVFVELMPSPLLGHHIVIRTALDAMGGIVTHWADPSNYQ
jgi:hypothetical protein